MYEMFTGMPPFYTQNKVKMMERIKSAKPQIPKTIPAECKDFVQKLLEKNPEKRLGKSGAAEVKEHKWLEGIDWEAVRNKQLSLPKPAIDWKDLRSREFVEQMF